MSDAELYDKPEDKPTEVNFAKVGELLDVVIKSANFDLPNIRAAAMEELKEIEEELAPDPEEFKPNLPFPPEPARYVMIGGAHSPQGPAGFTDAAGNVIEDKVEEPKPEPPVEDAPPPPPIENGVERRV